MTKIKVEGLDDINLMQLFAKEGVYKCDLDGVNVQKVLQERITKDRQLGKFPNEISKIQLGSVNGGEWFTLMYKEWGDDEWRTCSSSSHDVERAKKCFPEWFVDYLDTIDELVV